MIKKRRIITTTILRCNVTIILRCNVTIIMTRAGRIRPPNTVTTIPIHPPAATMGFSPAPTIAAAPAPSTAASMFG